MIIDTKKTDYYCPDCHENMVSVWKEEYYTLENPWRNWACGNCTWVGLDRDLVAANEGKDNTDSKPGQILKSDPLLAMMKISEMAEPEEVANPIPPRKRFREGGSLGPGFVGVVPSFPDSTAITSGALTSYKGFIIEQKPLEDSFDRFYILDKENGEPFWEALSLTGALIKVDELVDESNEDTDLASERLSEDAQLVLEKMKQRNIKLRKRQNKNR